MIAGGCSNAEAAAALGVSPLTIKKHLEHIYATLGVGTRSSAVARLLCQLGVEIRTAAFPVHYGRESAAV